MAVIGLLPAIDHQHVIVDEPLPVIKVPVFTKGLNSRQQKPEAGGRRGRILHDGQPGLAGIGQNAEVVGRRNGRLGEPGHVIIQTDVPIVHRGHPELGIEFQAIGDIGQAG